MIIYRIIFPNEKSYIGQTIKSLKERQREHLSELERSDFKVYRAIKKYGWESLKWEIVEFINVNKINHNLLNEREIYWISYFDSYKNGYNSTIGGKGSSGYIPSQKQINQMRERFTGDKNPTKKLEVREKMKSAWTNKRRKEQSERMKGNKISGGKGGPGFPLNGKWNEERKKRFSKYMKEKCQKDKEYLERRTKNLIKKLKEPEMKAKIKERMKGSKNPNFKYTYIIKKENEIFNTKGFTLLEFCQKKSNLKLNARSIEKKFIEKKTNKIKYKEWEIEKINEKK